MIFIFITDSGAKYATVFAYDKFLQASLIFMGKAQ